MYEFSGCLSECLREVWHGNSEYPELYEKHS